MISLILTYNSTAQINATLNLHYPFILQIINQSQEGAGNIPIIVVPIDYIHIGLNASTNSRTRIMQ